MFGISLEFGAPTQDLTRMVHDFAPALRNLMEQVRQEKKGVFLVLDDINGLASFPDFANWVKSLVDEIATSQKPLPLCLLLVGMEERRQSLIKSQPSLARVFDLIEIQPWSDQETSDFYESAFRRVSIEVQEDALQLLSGYAGGLPVLAHEIGDAAFSLDSDGKIDLDEALNAVFSAAEVVGRKHLEPQVFAAIKSPRYRTILRQVAGEHFRTSFTRAEMMKRLTQDHQKVFDNFLRKMQGLGVVVKDAERGGGAYRFNTRLHALYFFLEALRAKRSPKP
ncbi:MAG: hypothetical protein HY648_06560 [Acidobacteria bacterium]|nr:hypothetical protein [Acidobacteriota bacterium]